jgi:hypothetical protein
MPFGKDRPPTWRERRDSASLTISLSLHYHPTISLLLTVSLFPKKREGGRLVGWFRVVVY